MWSLSESEVGWLGEIAAERTVASATERLLAKAALEIRETVTVREDLEFAKGPDTFHAARLLNTTDAREWARLFVRMFGRSIGSPLDEGTMLAWFETGRARTALPSAAAVCGIMYETPPSAWWLTHPLVERIAEATALHHDTVLEVFRALIVAGYAVVNLEELLVSDLEPFAPLQGNGTSMIIERQAEGLAAQMIAHVTSLGKVVSVPH